MAQRLGDLLAHMHQAASEALGFVEGVNESDFLEDRRTQQAVLMSLVVPGEASTKLMQTHPQWAEQNPQIPLRSMRGMRNRLAHGYFDIDFHLVWHTVQVELPGLMPRLEQAIAAIASNGD